MLLQLQAAWHDSCMMHTDKIWKISHIPNLKGYHLVAEDPKHPGNRSS